MEIQSKPATSPGPAQMFTGEVWIDAISGSKEPPLVSLSSVHFAPGARTAWHSHGLGQTLYVTDGVGLVQSRGGETTRIRSGDVVRTPPGEWHWHGATPSDFMTHLSVLEHLAVASTESPESQWGDRVDDSEYEEQAKQAR